jgi:hypothetical protein
MLSALRCAFVESALTIAMWEEMTLSRPLWLQLRRLYTLMNWRYGESLQSTKLQLQVPKQVAKVIAAAARRQVIETPGA